MPIAREQLIADWQKHLDEESQAPSDGSRAAWLARLRIRLYRFLLSLYGQGDWNAPRAIDDPMETTKFAVIDASALPLSGKPAKDDSRIRAVLGAVAAAREQPLQPGPLAGRETAVAKAEVNLVPLNSHVDPNEWMTIASTVDGIDPRKVVAALNSRGIASRVVKHDGEVRIEVRAFRQSAAMEVIAELRYLLEAWAQRAERSPAKSSVTFNDIRVFLSYVFVGLLAGPLVSCVVIATIYATWPRELSPPEPELSAILAISICASAPIVAMYLHGQRRPKTDHSPRAD